MPCFQTQGTVGFLLSPLVLVCLLLLAGFLLSSVFFTAQRVFGTVLMLNRWPSASFPPSLFCGNGPDLLIGLQGCEWRRNIELESIWRSARSSLPPEVKVSRENLQDAQRGRPLDCSTIVVAQRHQKDTVGTILAIASPAHPRQKDPSRGEEHLSSSLLAAELAISPINDPAMPKGEGSPIVLVRGTTN